MAKFNPDVPEVQAPTYFGLSHPISEMHGDTSTGVALQGLGNIIHSAAVGADTVVKSVIDQAVYKGVDTARDAQTGAYEEAVNVPQDQRVGTRPDYQPPDVLPPPQPANPDQGLIPGTVARPVPAALELAAEKPIQTVGSVYTSGAKGALGLYYNGQLDMLAKDLRSQFPGYRDYIDAKIERVTGENPANAYLRNLQTIIQSSLTENRSDRDKALTFMEKPELANMPGYAKVVNDIQAGNTGGENPLAYAMKMTAPHRKILADNQAAAAEREALKFNREQLEEKANKDLAKNINDRIQQKTVTLFGNEVTYKDFTNLLEGLQTGVVRADSNQLDQMLQAGRIFRDSLYQDIWNDANTLHPGASETLVQSLGKDGSTKAKNYINSGLESVDFMLKNLSDKDYGQVHRTQRAIANLTKDDAMALMTSTDVNLQRWVRAAAALNLAGGQNAVNAIVKDAVADNIPGTLKSVTEGQKMIIATGGINLIDAIKGLKKAGVGVGDTPTAKFERAAPETLTNLPKNTIPDPTIPDAIKLNIINGSYGPANARLLDEFKSDTVDSKGRPIPGKQAVFNKMTAPEVTDAIYDMQKKGVAGRAWDNYVTWAENSHRQLFTEFVRNINDLGVNPNIEFRFDSDTHQVVIDFADSFFNTPFNKTNFPSDIANAQALSYMREINQLNAGLKSMIHIAEKQGLDPNAYLLNLMVTEGLQPERISNAGKLMTAVVSSQPPQTAEGEKKPDKPSTAEKFEGEVYNSLSKGMDLLKKGSSIMTDAIATPAGAAEVKTGAALEANAAHSSERWGNPLQKGFKVNHLTPIETSSGKKILVNKESAAAFKGFLEDLEATGYKIKDIGGYSLRENKAQPGRLSQHAWGNAIDINPSRNPFGTHRTDMPANVRELAAKHGLVWGGNWRHGDPMHFEYSGRSQLAGK